tara:strand:+ start:150 stop:977 length:828 start_codon:yes stop_codon:yes gene_type:complete
MNQIPETPEENEEILEDNVEQVEDNSNSVEDVSNDDLDGKKLNPLFSDEAEDDDYDYEDLDDEESRAVWYFAAFFIIVIVTGVIILAATVAQDSEKIKIRIPKGVGPSVINGKRAPGDTPMLLPGLISPVMHDADKANLSEAERVIGITVGDKYRAYLANAFTALGSKVVNDLVDDIPVSITYCDIHERARVFTSSERGKALNMGLGGWLKQEMFFYYNGEEFQHSAEKTPIPDYPYIVTTWGEWKQAHPNTQVYMGGGTIPKENTSVEKVLTNE